MLSTQRMARIPPSNLRSNAGTDVGLGRSRRQARVRLAPARPRQSRAGSRQRFGQGFLEAPHRPSTSCSLSSPNRPMRKLAVVRPLVALQRHAGRDLQRRRGEPLPSACRDRRCSDTTTPGASKPSAPRRSANPALGEHRAHPPPELHLRACSFSKPSASRLHHRRRAARAARRSASSRGRRGRRLRRSP